MKLGLSCEYKRSLSIVGRRPSEGQCLVHFLFPPLDGIYVCVCMFVLEEAEIDRERKRGEEQLLLMLIMKMVDGRNSALENSES